MSSDDPKPGDLLGGRFRLGTRTDRDWRSDSYRAVDEGRPDNPSVEVELLRGSGRELEQYERLVRREVDIALWLKDLQGVLPALAWAREESGWLWVARDLPTRLRPLDLRQGDLDSRVWRLLNAAQRVASLAAHGLVHRDLGPRAILEGPDDEVVLARFALARLDEVAEPLSGPYGLPFLHLRCAAPELFQNPGEADFRADVFALGVLLFRATCQRWPYPGPSLPQLIRQHQAVLLGGAPAPRPRDHDATISARLDTLIQQAIHPDPAMRMPTVQALTEGLEAYLTVGAQSSSGPVIRVQFEDELEDEAAAAAAAAAPAPTPAPVSRPTPAPTPRPTSRPTPAPTPRPAPVEQSPARAPLSPLAVDTGPEMVLRLEDLLVPADPDEPSPAPAAPEAALELSDGLELSDDLELGEGLELGEALGGDPTAPALELGEGLELGEAIDLGGGDPTAAAPALDFSAFETPPTPALSLPPAAPEPLPEEELLPPGAFDDFAVHEGSLVITIHPEELEEVVSSVRQLDPSGLSYALLDMSAVRHLGGKHMEALTEVAALTRRRGLQAGMFGVRREVRQILQLMEIDDHLPFLLQATNPRDALMEIASLA